jgi:hypothetical protein
MVHAHLRDRGLLVAGYHHFVASCSAHVCAIAVAFSKARGTGHSATVVKAKSALNGKERAHAYRRTFGYLQH